MVLFAFQFYPVCNCGKFITFGLGFVRSERVKTFSCRKSSIEKFQCLALAWVTVVTLEISLPLKELYGKQKES